MLEIRKKTIKGLESEGGRNGDCYFILQVSRDSLSKIK